jgi:hypothetical protein
MDVEVIHDEVDRVSRGIAGDYDFQSPSAVTSNPANGGHFKTGQ